MAQHEVEPVPRDSVDKGFWQLLSLCVGDPTTEKMNRVRDSYRGDPRTGLWVVMEGGKPIGCLGHIVQDTVVEIAHIAVLPVHERRGIARAMVETLAADYPNAALEAETSGDNVGFYKALGFAIAPSNRRPEYSNRWLCQRGCLV